MLELGPQRRGDRRVVAGVVWQGVAVQLEHRAALLARPGLGRRLDAVAERDRVQGTELME